MKQIQKLIEQLSLLRLELDYYGIDADELLKELKVREEHSYINAEYLVLDHIRQWDGKEDNSPLKSALKAKFAELESSRWISVKERLPENGNSVFVVKLDNAVPYVHIAWYNARLGSWFYRANAILNTCPPDYWMPIQPIKEEHEF